MKKHIIAGFIGGLVFFVLVIAILMILGGYDYTLIKILNPSCINEIHDKVARIKELSQKGILLTPAEYTNHIVSYYNSIIMLLVGLFAIFSFIGYFSLKSRMREQIQESLIEMLRDSKEFDKTIKDNIIGRITEEFVSNDTFEETSAEVATLKEKLIHFEESQVKRILEYQKNRGMGSIGRRPQINNIKEEPSLLGDVNDIISFLKDKNLINDCKVNIESLIRTSGIDIVFDETLPSSQSGYLRKINDTWVIGVNKNHNSKRQRFTLAHEFAHFILHKNDDNNSFEDEIFFRDENLTSIEYAANEFAASILMPQDLLEQCIIDNITDIEELANQFEVSVLAMKYRVMSLGYKLAYE